MLDSLNISQALVRGRSVVRTLEGIGAPISPEIREAVEFDKLTYSVDQQSDAARTALINATTPEGLNSALEQYAAVLTAQQVQDGVHNVLKVEKWRRLSAALIAEQENIFAYLSEGFQPLADMFTDAARNLPENLAEVTSLFQPSRTESEAARVTADICKQMSAIWQPYQKFAAMFGYLDDHRYIPYAIGEISSWASANSVSTEINDLRVTDAGKLYAPISPWVFILKQGAGLRLHPEPWLIREQAQTQLDTFGASIGDVGTTVVGSW